MKRLLAHWPDILAALILLALIAYGTYVLTRLG